MRAAEHRGIEIDADQVLFDGDAVVPVIGLGKLGACDEDRVGLREQSPHAPARQHLSDAQRVRGGNRTLAGGGRQDRRLQLLGDGNGRLSCVERATPQEDQRLLGGVELGDRQFDVPRIGRGQAWKSAGRPAIAGGLLQDVEGHLNVDGPRPVARETGEGCSNRVAHVLGCVGAEVEARHRRRGTALVDHLVESPATLR